MLQEGRSVTQMAPTVVQRRLGGLRTVNGCHWATLTGIALLGLSLRLYRIGKEDLWTDEWLSLQDAAHIARHNLHRPLFYLVLRPWLSYGGGDAWVRLPAVFFGVSAIVLLYLLGRRFASSSSALVACLIMAIAVPELDHSQEARMYTMASALTLASVYALVHWIECGGIWTLSVHLLLTYLAFLTTSTVVFGLLLAGGIGWMLLFYRRNWAAAVAMLTGYGLFLAAWWAVEQRYALMATLDWIPRPPRSALLSLHGELMTAGLGAVHGLQPSHLFQIAVSLLVLAVVAIALLAAWRRQPEARRVAVVAAWFYAVAIGMYGTSVLAHPVWVLRYLHYTAPALYLLIGIGIVSLWRWLRPVGLAAGAALLGLTALASADYFRLPVRENWRIVAAVVAEEAGPEDVVAVFGLTRLFSRYYQGRASVRGIRPHVIWPHSAETAETAQRTEAVLGDLLAQIPSHTGRTWIVVREDPRFQRVAFLERLAEYLRDR